MTHAGTITIGVDIDGGDLGAKLGEAVRRQLGPTLAKMQADLDKTGKSLTGLDSSAIADISAKADKAAKSTSGMASASRDAAKAQSQQKDTTERLSDSTAKLTKAQEEANAAVEVFGANSKEAEKFQKRLTKAEGQHTQALIDHRVESTKTARSQIVDLDDVTVAHERSARRHAVADNNIAASAERSAQRRIAAEAKAAAAEAGGDGGGAPPGAGSTTIRGGGRRRGGGGGRGGGRFPTGGFGGAALFNAGALAIGNLPAAATAITNVAGAVQQLGQAGLLLPGIFAGAATSVGTAALGFKGLGEAYKSFDKSLGPKAAEKAAAAMANLAPAAQKVLVAVHDLTPAFDGLRRNEQQNMFEGVDKTINDLATKSLPTLTRGTAEVGSAWNNTFKEIGRVGGLDSTQGFLDKIFGNTADAQNRANKAIEPLVHGLGTLTATSSNFLPRLADGLTVLTTRFDNFITKSAANGNLDKWINEGIDAGKHLGETFLNTGKIITDLTKAAGGDGGLLKSLDEGSTKLANFLGSDQGQAKLSAFFKDGREQLAQWLPILQNLGPILLDIYKASRQWADLLMPFLREALGLLDRFPGLVQDGLVAFLAFKTLSPFAGLLGDLGKVDSALGGIGGKADGLRGKLGLGLGGLVAVLGAPLGSGLITPSDGSAPSAGGALGGLGVNVATGIAAGFAVGGPAGAAWGAALGAVVSLAERIKGDLDRGKSEWEKKWAEDNNRPPGSPGTPQAQLDAVPPLRGIMSPSQFNPDGSPKPTVGTQLQQFIASGQAPPGWTIGPDGQLHGPGGQTLPGAPGAPPPPLAAVVDQSKLQTPFQFEPTQQQLDRAKQQTDLNIAAVQSLGDAITALPNGHFEIINPTPEVLANVEALGLKVTHLPNGAFDIDANTAPAESKMQAFLAKWSQTVITPQVQVPGQGTPGSNPLQIFAPPGRAGGGVIPGYSPGVDNVLWPMSRGEGVLIPEAVRGIGGAAGVYAINSAFRSGLSRRGYAGGGVVGFSDGGVLDPNAPPDGVIGLLQQIRDLLAGKGGTGPLVDTAQATSSIAKAGGTGQGGQLGPFGTPIKPRNRGYEAAAAAIQALGGDPEKFLGADPTTLMQQGTVAGSRGGRGAGVGGVTIDPATITAALAQLAQTGNLGPDLTGQGLDASSPVVKAIVSARNKKKGGLDDATIAGLVDQVVGGGGYTGTLDSTNSTLITALQTFRDKLAKQAATGAPPGFQGAVTGGGSVAQALQYAQQISGSGYQLGGVGQNGVWDCSGLISDIYAMLTGKPYTGSERYFTTTSNFPSLGFQPGFDPNSALNIGVNQEHMAGTLAGIPIESGGPSGGGVTFGQGQGALQSQFGSNQFHLPIGFDPSTMGLGMPTAPGLPGANIATAGNPVPVYIVGNPAAQQGLNMLDQNLLSPLAQGVGEAASNVAGDTLSALGSTHLGTGAQPGPNPVSPGQLVTERNPLALFGLAGFPVPDFTRQGGQNLQFTQNQGPPSLPSGQTFSDTAALTERTQTDLQAQLQAGFDQLTTVMEEVRQRLTDQALIPILQTAIQQGIEGLKGAIVADLGTAIGQAAAPIIADAVKAAIPTQTSTPGGDAGTAASNAAGSVITALTGASGGAIVGGTTGKDSVPALLMPGEWVLNTSDVARMGGTAGVARFVSALGRGGIRGYASGGDVTSKANATVGADFFGVSEVPIIGAIVNLLVQVLLKIIGVNIEVRDTMTKMTDEFRAFRGDAFKAFDAQGRLLNDTSALLDRSSTSEQTAADERIRILKIVIQALIKYIIEKVIVPITKAVANAAIQAGASAAGAAINTQAPGAGGIVSSLISSAGQAGVEIASQIGSDFAVAASDVIVQGVAQLLQSFFPTLTTGVFGGAWLESIIGPTNAVLGGLLGGLLAPILGVVNFDDGGVATGVGWMPKNTLAPERVLSSSNTVSFDQLPGRIDRLLNHLESGGGSSRSVDVGGIHLHGTQATPEAVRDNLLALI